jgi:phosphoglycolate phosphatase-like HAD superfamily hydrolase
MYVAGASGTECVHKKRADWGYALITRLLGCKYPSIERLGATAQDVRLDLYPQVSGVLQELHRSGVRLGIVSNIGQETEEQVRRVLEEGTQANDPLRAV